MRMRTTATAAMAASTKMPTIWSANRILNFICSRSYLRGAPASTFARILVKKLQEVRVIGGDVLEHFRENHANAREFRALYIVEIPRCQDLPRVHHDKTVGQGCGKLRIVRHGDDRAPAP